MDNSLFINSQLVGFGLFPKITPTNKHLYSLVFCLVCLGLIITYPIYSHSLLLLLFLFIIN